jgi:hypothetical protein
MMCGSMCARPVVKKTPPENKFNDIVTLHAPEITTQMSMVKTIQKYLTGVVSKPSARYI